MGNPGHTRVGNDTCNVACAIVPSISFISSVKCRVYQRNRVILRCTEGKCCVFMLVVDTNCFTTVVIMNANRDERLAHATC